MKIALSLSCVKRELMAAPGSCHQHDMGMYTKSKRQSRFEIEAFWTLWGQGQ